MTHTADGIVDDGQKLVRRVAAFAPAEFLQALLNSPVVSQTLLGIGRKVLAQPEWFGASFEVYLFVATVFFVLSYTMSQASYRLEKELGIGER